MKVFKRASLLLLVVCVAVCVCATPLRTQRPERVRVPAASAAGALLSPADYAVTALPGLPAGVQLKQYAGYVTVNATHQRRLFFWHVEAENDAAGHAPVVLWLNGGPGCSSLSGMLSENGPLWPLANGSLAYNAAGWTQAAHMIWLESPAGVGFSYSNTPSDYSVGDQRTADDAYVFLTQFFTIFSHLASREFYISGESYGGHYVPELAARILQGNRDARGSTPVINLHGFLVGNPWTDAPLDNRGAIDFWFNHALIGNSTYDGLVANCDFWHDGPFRDSALCDKFSDEANKEMTDINLYQVYEDVCTGDSGAFPHHALRLTQMLRKAGLPLGAAAVQPPTSPCIDDYVTTYLNRADVQKAIHAQPTRWTICSSIVNYSYSDLLTSVLPVYRSLIGTGKLRMLVYSGDVDGVVPFTGTRAWLGALKLTPSATPRHQWLVEGQTGGWVEEYAELTFATVRGAGHMVPGTQPDRALFMLKAFLDNRPL